MDDTALAASTILERAKCGSLADVRKLTLYGLGLCDVSAVSACANLSVLSLVGNHVATLAPGGRKRVRFEFCPPEEPNRRVVKEPVTDRIGETTDGKETSVSATDASPTKPGGSPEKPPATDGGVDDARATSSEEEDLSEALPESFRLAMFVKTARKDRSAFASGTKSDAGNDARDAEPVTVTGEDAETVTAQHIEVRTATRAPRRLRNALYTPSRKKKKAAVAWIAGPGCGSPSEMHTTSRRRGVATTARGSIRRRGHA